MRQGAAKIASMTATLILVIFWPAITHAQAETGAQEHQASNMAAVTTPPAKTEFEGHFSLPYQVQCHGHKLTAGQYTLVVKTVGENKMVTFQKDGSDVVLPSRVVTPTSYSGGGHSAVMLRHGPGPSAHTLEGVYLENLKVVLFLDETGKSAPLDKIFASVIRVPIS